MPIYLCRADGTPTYARARWLLIVGEHRSDLSLKDGYIGCQAWSDLDHVSWSGKQKLLLAAYQTPKTEQEERCRHTAHLVYATLGTRPCLAGQLQSRKRYLLTAQQQKIQPTLAPCSFAWPVHHLRAPAQTTGPRSQPSRRSNGLRSPLAPYWTPVEGRT